MSFVVGFLFCFVWAYLFLESFMVIWFQYLLDLKFWMLKKHLFWALVLIFDIYTVFSCLKFGFEVLFVVSPVRSYFLICLSIASHFGPKIAIWTLEKENKTQFLGSGPYSFKCAFFLFKCFMKRLDFVFPHILFEWFVGIMTTIVHRLEWYFLTFYLFIVMLQSEEPPMSVLHFQYPEWPDHGVPKNTFVVREILKRIYQVPPNLGPIVVHCRLNSFLWLACLGDVYLSYMWMFSWHPDSLTQCRYWENWNILHNS